MMTWLQILMWICGKQYRSKFLDLCGSGSCFRIHQPQVHLEMPFSTSDLPTHLRLSKVLGLFDILDRASCLGKVL